MEKKGTNKPAPNKDFVIKLDEFGRPNKKMNEESIVISFEVEDTRDYDGDENCPEMKLTLNQRQVGSNKW